MAETLFGIAGYGGKLPMPWPSERVTGQTAYENKFSEGYGLTTESKLVQVIDNVVGFDYN